MRHHALASSALVLAVPALLAGCTSEPKTDAQGSLGIAVGATRGTAAAASASDPLAQLKAATVTIASVEAHRTDGTWVVIDSGLPATIDLVAVLGSGGAVSLPADTIPEGLYDALQIAITKVELTGQDDATVLLAAPGAGWTAQVPVDVSVVAGEVTMIQLALRCDTSFQVAGGAFEFDPDFDVEGVVH